MNITKLYQFCSKIAIDAVKQPGSQLRFKDLTKTEAFNKLDLRVGNVIKVEEVKGQPQLYLIEVDLGNETRTVISALRQFLKPEEMMGLGVLLANLKKRQLGGFESHGMLLIAKKDSKIEVIKPVGNIGDKLFIEQDGLKADVEVSERYWRRVTEDIQTDDDGIFLYLDQKVKTKLGFIKSTLNNAKIQ